MKLNPRIKVKLDPRIKEGCIPFDSFDAKNEEVQSFIGKEGYFADRISEFAYISILTKNVLKTISLDKYDDTPYKTNITSWGYFLPAEWVKPEEPRKKYEPFSIDSWLLNNDIGDVIQFRRKNNALVHFMIFAGYTTEKGTDTNLNGIGAIILGGNQYSFQTLFESYEIMIDGKWLPFGVEVKE